MDEGRFSPENPGDKEKKEGDEFKCSVIMLEDNKELYNELCKEIKRRAASLDRMAAKIGKLRDAGEIDTEEFRGVSDVIIFLKEEIVKLEKEKKKTAKNIEEVINNPRWHEVAFLLDDYSPSNKDN